MDESTPIYPIAVTTHLSVTADPDFGSITDTETAMTIDHPHRHRHPPSRPQDATVRARVASSEPESIPHLRVTLLLALVAAVLAALALG